MVVLLIIYSSMSTFSGLVCICCCDGSYPNGWVYEEAVCWIGWDDWACIFDWAWNTGVELSLSSIT